MKTVLNSRAILWAIGVLQPVSAEEIRSYFRTVLDDTGDMPTAKEFHRFCLTASNMNQLVRVGRDPDLFALTLRGSRYLSKDQRRARDRQRMFLLKEARQGRVWASREADATGLGGDAPSVDAWLLQQGGEAKSLGLYVPRGRATWPRISPQQLNTGPSPASRDMSSPPFLSFASPKQLAIASRRRVDSLTLDYTTLGLMLGVSPKLVQQIAWRPERHYRSFELPKRSGGVRQIKSPRVFLKVIQQFLADYVLAGLPISNAVFSYRAGASIQDNARRHIGSNYVANIDIRDFFGSIKKDRVMAILTDNGMPGMAAALVGELVTLDDALPQGAPTSPSLSNAFLRPFDDSMGAECHRQGLSYSRYADDITVSGGDKKAIDNTLRMAKSQLAENYSLHLNEDKTRITSRHGQQRVTGLVVNSRAVPPRTFRRKVRAAFHNAKKQGNPDEKCLRRLAGYLSYLKSFDALGGTPELARYEEILEAIS